MVTVKAYKVSHGEESFLGELNPRLPIPRKGEIISFEENCEQYKVIAVSYDYSVDGVLIEIMTRMTDYEEEWYNQ